MKAFVAELNRRNVLRVAVLYIAFSWLLLQVAETVLPIFEVPEWVLRFLVVLLALGFVPALVLSWIYEITPEGIKRETEVHLDDSITRQTGRKLDIAVIALLLVAITIYLFSENTPSPTGQSQRFAEAENALQSSSSPVTSPALVKGVAVLPFENLSSDPENAFFASGVHEDILTHLAAIKDARVISRTSVKQYAGTRMSMREIAHQLGVTHLVEGSVRRHGNKVRVTVQLVDGRSDQHLWAKNYDRTLRDIFEIQSEIARNIAFHVKDKLSPEELAHIDRKSTSSTRAHDLLLRSRSLSQTSLRSAESLREPLTLVDQALIADPTFIEAWLERAHLCSLMVWWQTPEATECAKQSVAKVAQLASNSAAAHIAHGIYLYRVERRYQSAMAALQRAAAAQPNNVKLWQYIGYVGRRLFMWPEALEALNNVVQLSPNVEQSYENYVETLEFSGAVEKALAQAELAYQRFPDSPVLRLILADIKRKHFGDMTDYGAALQALPAEYRWSFGDPFIGDAFRSNAERLEWAQAYEKLVPFGIPRIEGMRAELSMLEGNMAESDRLSISSYHLTMDILGENWRQMDSTFMLSVVAYTSARAKLFNQAQEAIALQEALLSKQEDSLAKTEVGPLIAITYAEMGELEKGWRNMKQLLNAPGGVSVWDLKQNLLLKHYFSDVEEYQALTSDLMVGQRYQ